MITPDTFSRLTMALTLSRRRWIPLSSTSSSMETRTNPLYGDMSPVAVQGTNQRQSNDALPDFNYRRGELQDFILQVADIFFPLSQQSLFLFQDDPVFFQPFADIDEILHATDYLPFKILQGATAVFYGELRSPSCMVVSP